jgi:hypothetical protein
VQKLKVAKPVTAGKMLAVIVWSTSNTVLCWKKFTVYYPSGTYTDIFDFCMGRCRHSSASVVLVPSQANMIVSGHLLQTVLQIQVPIIW